MSELRLIRLDPRHMGDFERLLSGREFGGCYCAVWDRFGEDWSDVCKNRPHENLEHTRQRVRGGQHAGYLVERETDGAIIAWTGTGPKTAFPLLKTRPGSAKTPFDDKTWAIGCLSVAYAHRGRGYSREIVELLIEEARAAGAPSLEAYPVEPDNEDMASRGSRKLYTDLGFEMADGEPDGEVHALRMVKRLDAPQ